MEKVYKSNDVSARIGVPYYNKNYANPFGCVYPADPLGMLYLRALSFLEGGLAPTVLRCKPAHVTPCLASRYAAHKAKGSASGLVTWRQLPFNAARVRTH